MVRIAHIAFNISDSCIQLAVEPSYHLYGRHHSVSRHHTNNANAISTSLPNALSPAVSPVITPTLFPLSALHRRRSNRTRLGGRVGPAKAFPEILPLWIDLGAPGRTTAAGSVVLAIDKLVEVLRCAFGACLDSLSGLRGHLARLCGEIR